MSLKPVSGKIESQELNDNFSYLDSIKAGMQDLAKAIKGPTETHDTITVLQNKYPNGADGVHLVLSNKHIYVWKDNNWTDAGPYQAMEIDNKSVTRRKLSDELSGINDFEIKPYFDSEGRLIRIEESDGGELPVKKTTIRYNKDGFVDFTQLHADGKIVESKYTFDNEGRIKSIKNEVIQ